jgi:hypothetical protein
MRNLISILAVGSICFCAGATAHAAQNDDVLARVEALEKENAAIRKENDLLRENKTLRQQNAALRSSPLPRPLRAETPPQPPQAELEPAIKPVSKLDSFGAYAADLPLAYKTPAAVEQGQFRVWAEGGANWTGGDPNPRFFTPFLASDLFSGNTPASSSFDLKPRLGWEGAAGFDYRFAGQPWHVSGQFRYGEGKATGSFATSSSAGPATLALLGLNSLDVSDAIDASGRETHWLADLAIGRDVLGSGRDAMQLKAGLRISEFAATVNSFETVNIAAVPIFALLERATLTDNLSQHSRFLGAGPRVGVEGSVPFAGGWTFDYMGDAAALFGTQTFSQAFTFSQGSLPALGFTSQTSSFANADQRFNTVFNADLQVGLSYWLSQHVKLSASYRVDAYFNVLTGLSAVNDPTKLQTMDRYIHGPHVGVSAQF